MTTFDDRTDLFEKKFALDETLRFKADARHAKLFGLWIAERLGMEGETAATYAGEVVVSSLREEGDDDILAHVQPDLEARGVAIPEKELREQLVACLREAQVQVLKEAG